MSIIFFGVKVQVIAGIYKGKTGRVYSYTNKTCSLIGDGDSTTIQGMLKRPRDFTGHIPRSHINTLDWRTPPRLYFIRSNHTAFYTSIINYCNEYFPHYLPARLREHNGQPLLGDPPRSKVPVYDKFWCAECKVKGWLEEFWILYCDAFYDQKPAAAIKIQSIIRKYLQRKYYLEILSLKPGGVGYLEAKNEFESSC
jgi:hypothetical protein